MTFVTCDKTTVCRSVRIVPTFRSRPRRVRAGKTMPRATSSQRGYGSARWKKARAVHLKREPNCRLCAERGVVTTGTTVDHIVPHRGDQRLFWDTSNWQTTCSPCHNSVKQTQERSGYRPGCDENGRPLDEAHHWNRGRGG